jgi:EAL domain-containing protein (putative c-di-GMP-specific phosphodiesterase class I)
VVVLRRLRDLGVRSSLDDFGTGFSTLVRIQRLPVAEVKIDQSFVAALDSGGDDGVVRAVIGLAHGLGLGVVAEGVETDEVRQRLAALGCDAGQGWALARAMPPDEATDWLRAHRQRPPDSAGARLRVVGDDEAGGG